MFTLKRPSDQQLEAFLERHRNAPFSYAEVGASRGAGLPVDYRIDRHRTKLGRGPGVFLAAKKALERWAMFDRGWIRIFPEVPQVREGSVVAVVPAHLWFYSVNLCRIVYVLDTSEPSHVFGFAYGTLGEHAARGEERFTVSWDGGEEPVFYEVLAFSKPKAFLARAGYPIGRMIQRKFARGSVRAMREAVRCAVD